MLVVITCLPKQKTQRRRFDPWVRKIPWRRKCQPLPVFLPGKFHGQTSLVGYSPWGCKDSDMTESAHTHNLFMKTHLKNYLKCTILDVWGWCTGTTQRDGMGREEGGGFRMGNTCIPVADSF